MVDEPSVELLEMSHPPIVHVHPRRFPAIAVQGDTLHTWLDDIDQVVRGLAPVTDLVDLRDQLAGFLATYVSVLSDRGFDFPYVRRA